MKKLAKRLSIILCLGVIITVAIQFPMASISRAEGGDASEIERPFQLPFAEPSSPDTWLMAQPYGNTTGAYRQRFTTYGASGGIHFGVDLSAPCSTEIVAVADGIVFAVDGPFGSPPHNLMIDHPELGYASMYGHLLEAPNLVPGQRVSQGEVVALVGDSAELCYRRAHLHLEIRDLDHIRKYNPMTLIDTNWDNLTLISSSGRSYARDLDDVRKWQTLYDQPVAQTGGPILNDFANPWPLDWDKQTSANVISAGFNTVEQVQTVVPAPTSLASSAIAQQITLDDCCTRPYWSDDSREVRFIDQPTSNAPVGIWGIDITKAERALTFVTNQLGETSPDDEYITYPDNVSELTIIERVEDGQKWTLDTDGRSIRFTPDGKSVIWTSYDEDAPRDTRLETIWLADLDGSNIRSIFSARRTDLITWLSETELLMVRGFGGTSDEQLFVLSLEDGTETILLNTPRIRGLAFSPNKRYLVYYITFEDNSNQNGLWLYDLKNREEQPQKLPFFGTYRWQDDNNLIYVPFEIDATEHNFYQYNIPSGQSQALFPDGTGLVIANNDWRISPDGNKIVLAAVNGLEPDGIWVLDLSAGKPMENRYNLPAFKFFSEQISNIPQ